MIIIITVSANACQTRELEGRENVDYELMDIRTPLAVSPNARVEIGEDGIVHVLAGPVTLHLENSVCEELTATLARAMVGLSRRTNRPRTPALRLICCVAGED